MGDRYEEAQELRETVDNMTDKECEDTFGLSKEEMYERITNDSTSKD